MSDIEILRKALERYRNATHENAAFKDNVIIFLEKEIDNYRDKLFKMALNSMYGVQTAGAITTGRINESKNENAVRELHNKYDDLCERVEQLGQMVENNMNSTTDGFMTLSRKTASWKLVAECLLSNGYFVCSHIDDDNNGETITIEYWRA